MSELFLPFSRICTARKKIMLLSDIRRIFGILIILTPSSPYSKELWKTFCLSPWTKVHPKEIELGRQWQWTFRDCYVGRESCRNVRSFQLLAFSQSCTAFAAAKHSFPFSIFYIFFFFLEWEGFSPQVRKASETSSWEICQAQRPPPLEYICSDADESLWIMQCRYYFFAVSHDIVASDNRTIFWGICKEKGKKGNALRFSGKL